MALGQEAAEPGLITRDCSGNQAAQAVPPPTSVEGIPIRAAGTTQSTQ